MKRAGLTLATALWLHASALHAQAPASASEANAPQAPPLLGIGPEMPPSVDPAMMPPLRPASRPRPLFELHGFAAIWLTLATDQSAPQHATETFRIRWAMLRLDAHPHPDLHVLMRLSFVVEIPLYDLSISWTALPAFNLTFGQFRVPFGASATTLGTQLNMLDRPTYVSAMTKATYRDVGLMIGSGDAGLFEGVLHYRLAVTSGEGRFLVGDPTQIRDVRDLLWSARVLLDAGPLIAPATRLALGASGSWTRDAALTGVDASSRAANLLGRTWTPYAQERETFLVGADLTFTHAGFFAQAEWMWLDSRGVGGTAMRSATGASLELAYTLPFDLEGVTFQPVLRGEFADPDLAHASDQYGIVAGGLNVRPFAFFQASVFGQATFYRDAAGDEAVGGELTVRGTSGF
jgi:hypothetical protein